MTFEALGTRLRRLALQGLIVIGILELRCLPAYSQSDRTLPDCAAATIQSAHDAASDGDSLTLPQFCGDSGRYSDGQRVILTKDITLRGHDSCVYDSKGRATNCDTVITDAHTDDQPLFECKLNANKICRIARMKIVGSGSRAPASLSYVLLVVGDETNTDRGGPEDARRFVFNHLVLENLQGYQPWIRSAYGQISNSTITLPTNSANYIPFYCAGPSDFNYADRRWSEAAGFGGGEAVIVENNTMDRPGAGDVFYVFMDGYGGCRYVVRFNDIYNAWIELHGTESGGRARGGRLMEAYHNNFTCSISTSANCGTIVNIRSGPVISFNNTASGFSFNPAAANLNNQRQEESYVGGIADGSNPLDVNDGGNSTLAFSVASNNDPVSNGFQSVTVSGTDWTTDQWRGYSITKVGCKPPPNPWLNPCSALVSSNTLTTITYGFDHYGTPPSDFPAVNFRTSDQFTLNKVTHVWDGACRGGGSLLSARYATAFSHSGTTATVTTAGAHGLLSGDKVIVSDVGSAEPGVYFSGTVTVIDCNGDCTESSTEFRYRLGGEPSGDPTFGVITKVPSGWNDQVTEECYQFLNTQRGSNLVFNPSHWPISIRANEHYYDYAGTQQMNSTTPFDGRAGVGVGTIANRPTGCATGVFYWATDEGNDWITGGSPNDGKGYKCTATDVWTDFYNPLVYPSPLAGDGPNR